MQWNGVAVFPNPDEKFERSGNIECTLRLRFVLASETKFHWVRASERTRNSIQAEKRIRLILRAGLPEIPRMHIASAATDLLNFP
jgi:hypothetical protein